MFFFYHNIYADTFVKIICARINIDSILDKLSWVSCEKCHYMVGLKVPILIENGDSVCFYSYRVAVLMNHVILTKARLGFSLSSGVTKLKGDLPMIFSTQPWC